MKATRPPICGHHRSQKLDELVKNGNCSYPVGGEGGTARRGATNCSRWQEQQHSIAQHSVRDPSAYLFSDEGDETGNLIFGLCFPMAPIAAERSHLETEAGGQPPDLVKGQGAASWARPVTAGSASWAPATVLLSTLCCFSNFMKKKGRSGTAGRGIAGATVFRHVAADKLGRRRR